MWVAERRNPRLVPAEWNGALVAPDQMEATMMKSCRIAMSTVVAFGCAVALHAQAPPSQASSRDLPGAITVTGCVERADEVAGNSAAAATVDSLSFVLIHAVKGPAAETPTATTGTTGASTSSTKPIAKGTMYRLDGDVRTLNPHVGHQVEITGSILAPTATAADSADATSAANAARMKVDQIKMVSDTCDR
jgi:hypothetical protein